MTVLGGHTDDVDQFHSDGHRLLGRWKQCRAPRRAALLAHELGARLRILHVLNTAGCKTLGNWLLPSSNIDLKVAQARDALRRLAVEISTAHDLTATVEVAVGDPFETLMRAADTVDLVVLGRRGQGRLKGWLEGRTVDRMLRICRRPVLVVQTPAHGPYRRVLVPVDFTTTSDAAMRVADQVRRETSLHVFHAIESHREAVLRGVRNVVANALDWAPPAGRVRVSIRGDSDGIHVVVDDSGPGVPLEERARIFDPFVRGRIRQGRRIGYGLGLAIARSAVEAHGGTISVTESPLGGARFTMTLRRCQRAASS